MSAANESFQAPPPPTSESQPRAPRPKLLPFGIALIVLGLLVLGAGFAKLVPSGISTGLVVGLAGIVLVAFSFFPLPVVPKAEEPLSFFDRITGIFYEPTRVFRNIRIHPRWVGPFVVIVV